MAKSDLESARFHVAALERVLSAPENDPAALRKVRCLCFAAWQAVPDDDCGEHLMNLEAYARALLSGAGQRHMLRAQVRETLEAFEKRLEMIEAGRLQFRAEPGALQPASVRLR
jgi:hypothetical protein